MGINQENKVKSLKEYFMTRGNVRDTTLCRRKVVFKMERAWYQILFCVHACVCTHTHRWKITLPKRLASTSGGGMFSVCAFPIFQISYERNCFHFIKM